jgi:hypothetical protein
MSKEEQVKRLLEFYESNSIIQKILRKEITSSSLRATDKKWFHQIIQPLVNCYTNHHKSDIANFLLCHAEWTPSQLACGKGNKSCESRCAVDQAQETEDDTV